MSLDKEKYEKIKIKVEDVLVQLVAKIVIFFRSLFYSIKKFLNKKIEEHRHDYREYPDEFDENSINFDNVVYTHYSHRSYSKANPKEDNYDLNYYIFNSNISNEKEEKREKDYMDPTEEDYDYYSYDYEFD